MRDGGTKEGRVLVAPRNGGGDGRCQQWGQLKDNVVYMRVLEIPK